MRENLEHQLQVLTERVAELEAHVLSDPPARKTLRGEVRDLIFSPSRAYVGTALLGIVLALAAITVSLTFTNEQIDRLDRTAVIIERLLDRRAR